MKKILTFLIVLTSYSLSSQNYVLDPSFGNQGYVTTPIAGQSESPIKVVVQADQKIVVGGITTYGGSPFGDFNYLLTRYDEEGTLDTSFGEDGIVETDFLGDNRISQIYVSPDEKIYVSGTIVKDGIHSFSLARYLSSGELDNTFGASGIYIYPFNTGSITSIGMGVQQDGKIILLGDLYNLSSNNFDLILLRVDENGVQDPTFGDNGVVMLDTQVNGSSGQAENAKGLTILSNGDVLVYGSRASSAALFKFKPNGSLDTSFGDNGIVSFKWSDNTLNTIWAAKERDDGKIVISGNAYLSDDTYSDNAIAILKADGTFDTDFAEDGKRLFSISDSFELPVNIILQPDHKVIIGGRIQGSSFLFSSPSRPFLLRITETGALDPSFGIDGLIMQTYHPTFSTYTDLITQADGKLLAIGSVNSFSERDIMVARFTREGELANHNIIDDLPKFKLFPNPVEEELVIAYSVNQTEVISILLYNAQGQLLESSIEQVVGKDHPEPLVINSPWPQGIYFIRIVGNTFEETFKLYKL